jgi:hypothetical protein
VLDFYRSAMYQEDGGVKGGYVGINGVTDFFILGLQSAPYFLMKPFPWEADSLLQLIQSLENFVLALALLFLFFKAAKIDSLLAIKWALYLFMALSVYGLVVFNYGTAVRYKFPFILIVVIGMAYDLYLTHGVFLLRRKS